eukprot:9809626-Alexandrium_andersonii.AAC.1
MGALALGKDSGCHAQTRRGKDVQRWKRWERGSPCRPQGQKPEEMPELPPRAHAHTRARAHTHTVRKRTHEHAQRPQRH